MQPGDFFLTHGSGFLPALIDFGEWLQRAGPDRWATHAGLLDHFDETRNDWATIEATGSGVEQCWLSSHGEADVNYRVVDSHLDARGRTLAVAQAHDWLGVAYGFVTFASIAVDILTPSPLMVRSKRTLICSELVARALYHGGWDCPALDFGRVTPADLAKWFRVESLS